MRSFALLIAAVVSLSSAAQAAADVTAPVITHTPAANPPPGDVHIQAKVTDESKVFPQVFWRAPKGSYVTPIDMKPVKGEKNMWSAMIPRKGSAEIEYYIEAYDEYGNGPARAGDPDAPIKVAGAAVAAAPAAAPAPAPAAAPPPAAAPAPAAAPVHAAAPPPAAAPAPAAKPEPAPVAKPEPPPAAKPEPPPAVVHQAPPPAAAPAPAPAPAAAKPSAPAASWSSSPSGPTHITQLGATARSAVLPGWGQFATGHTMRGAIFAGLGAITLGSAIELGVRANQANNIYESAPYAYRNSAYDQASSYATSRNLMIAATVLVWAASAADAFFFYQP